MTSDTRGANCSHQIQVNAVTPYSRPAYGEAVGV